MKTVYDVGAHQGGSTARYLALGYKVVAIEASPIMAGMLRKRFAAEIADGRVTLLNIGVGNKDGTLPFYVSKNNLWSSFNREYALRGGGADEVLVTARKLADVITEHGEPEFVKIDVEGVDYECLQSLHEAGITPNYLSCEGDRERGSDMAVLLVRMGYTKFQLIRQDSLDNYMIPPPGTFASVKWSARQWLRLELRRRPGLHGALAKSVGAVKSAKAALVKAVTPPGPPPGPWDPNAGPAPMEHVDGWCPPSEFVWRWEGVLQSGLIDSVWWDIHAAR